MSPHTAYRRVGYLAKPHGVKGAFTVFLETDFSGWLARQTRIYADIDGEMTCWQVTSARNQHAKFIMTVDALKDRNDVEARRGVGLFVTEEDARAVADDPDFFYNSDLVGLDLVDAESEEVYGRVVSVMEMPAQNLLEIERSQGRPFFFPFTKPLIDDVDMAAGAIRVRMVPGLMECNEPSSEDKRG